MMWLSFAFKNSVRSLRRYVNYLAACSFAVMIFYMFSAFVLNPAVHHGYMTHTAQQVLASCQFIVIVFAAFFIFFFHSGLLRLRSKEFGLLLTLGIIPKQMGRWIFFESLILGFVSIVSGMILGLLFSKLFLLTMAAALQLPHVIPFAVPPASVLLTAVFFGALFLCEAYLASRRVMGLSPTALFVEQRSAQKVPRFSVWWIVIGLTCLGAGYYMAVSESREFIRDLIPILILTSAGTYFLYSQVLIMILTVLRRRALSGVSLLVVSRLMYRLKDNARVLTVVTMLTAVVLTSMGSVLGLQQIVGENSLRVNPMNVMIASNAANSTHFSATRLRHILNTHGVRIAAENTSSIFVATLRTMSGQWVGVQVMSLSTYNSLRAEFLTDSRLKKYIPALPRIRTAHAELMVPYPLIVSKRLTPIRAELKIGRAVETIHIQKQSNVRVVDESNQLPDFELVVSNEDYRKWELDIPKSMKWTIYSAMLSHWVKSRSAVRQIQDAVASRNLAVSATVTGFKQTQELLSVMLFSGFFISILFFLTAGGSIYFRLDSRLEEDRKQFRTFQRLGLQRKEIGRLLSIELLLLFFVPVGVALVHTTVAIIDLGHLVLLSAGEWGILAIVAAVYCILMFIFFGVLRIKYLQRAMNQTMG